MLERSSAGVLQSRCSQKFCKIHRKKSAPEFFNKVVGRRPQAYYFIKKRDSGTGGNLEYFEEHLFYRTVVADCFCIYQNINYQKASVSGLIISKSYEEIGRREKSKYQLPTHINYQRCTLVKGLFKPFSFSKIALITPLLYNNFFFEI